VLPKGAGSEVVSARWRLLLGHVVQRCRLGKPFQRVRETVRLRTGSDQERSYRGPTGQREALPGSTTLTEVRPQAARHLTEARRASTKVSIKWMKSNALLEVHRCADFGAGPVPVLSTRRKVLCPCSGLGIGLERLGHREVYAKYRLIECDFHWKHTLLALPDRTPV